jgi:hypothetical protein
LPFLLHVDTGEPHPRTPEIIDLAAQVVEAGGIEAWSKLSVADILAKLGAGEEAAHAGGDRTGQQDGTRRLGDDDKERGLPGGRDGLIGQRPRAADGSGVRGVRKAKELHGQMIEDPDRENQGKPQRT